MCMAAAAAADMLHFPRSAELRCSITLSNGGNL